MSAPILRVFWKKLLFVVDKISPEFATKLLHFKVTGKWPNLKEPKDFNEKLQWLKFNEHPYLKSVLSDKYSAYEYVEKHCGKAVVNNLIEVYEYANDVQWNELPEKFAIKCTHGSGYNFVVKDKGNADKIHILKSLDSWLKELYGKKSLEYHYDLINPKIIVEDCIEDNHGFLPRDYKIYCFNGEAKLVLVCSEREDKLRLDFFDLEWKRLPIGHRENESIKGIQRPSCFDDMIAYAEKLSSPFKFVRIDFYDKDGKAIFGEFTFTPAANMANYYNESGLHYLGELLELN